MRRVWTAAILGFGTALLALGCSGNLLGEFKSETDESHLFEAEQLMNDGQWTEAIAKFDDMSTDFRAKREVQLKRAKAYAGRCGLDLIGLAESLSNGTFTSFLGLLMGSFPGATASRRDDCITAEGLITAIASNPAQRTADENITMAFVAFAKIGTILNLRADTNDDGNADWANDGSCTVGNGTTNFLTDLEAGHVATGLAIAVASLAASASTIGGGQVTSINAICVAVNGSPLDFCGETDPTALSATEILGIRTVIQEGQTGIGLGTCTDVPDSVANCTCP